MTQDPSREVAVAVHIDEALAAPARATRLADRVHLARPEQASPERRA